MFLLIVIFSILSIIFPYFLWHKYTTYLKHMIKLNKPKGTSFLLGNFDLISEPIEIFYKKMREYAKECYPHYCIRFVYAYGLILYSPEDCKIFLSSKKHSFKSDFYDILKNWLQSGLLISGGEKWIQRRRILTPAFHFNILKDFVGVFNDEVNNLSEIITKNLNEPIDIVPSITDFALNTLNETAMGYKLDPKNEIQREYRNSLLEMEEIFMYRVRRPWLFENWLYFFTSTYRKEMKLVKILHNFTRKVIKERIDNFTSNLELDFEDKEMNEIYGTKKGRLAMLDILIQAYKDGEQIDYEGICEEVDTFMFEGHDTTASASTFCLMLIANHPEIQEQIYEEIKSIIGEKSEPDYKDYQKMEFLERCIKESLRLYPSVYFISRWSDEETILHTGHVVPKNTRVHISIIDLHRNPIIYPNPEKFDPDRFLPENCKGRHPFAYAPFSAGPRNCIGQRFAMLEMKSLVAGLVLKFKLAPIDTPETIVVRAEIILKTKNGIKIEFNER